ncbi:LOW QUALITY PROTEIN: phosphotransferase, partial [Streptomyces sp. SPB78]
MPPLHPNEIPTTPALVRELLATQMPEWAGLPLRYAGAGTDNTMYRLGDEYVVRLPRTPEGSPARELTWLPRLAPHLSHRVPEPLRHGAPTDRFPAEWTVSRWIEGEEPGPGTVRDWTAFGADLATFVRELRGAPLMGARRADGLSWYRGGQLRGIAAQTEAALAGCAALGDALDLDLTALREVWKTALALPDAEGPEGWLHGDLRPANLLVEDGRLHAVLDFGTLSLGLPDAEHSPVFDLPPEARTAYRESPRPGRHDLDPCTRLGPRGRGAGGPVLLENAPGLRGRERDASPQRPGRRGRYGSGRPGPRHGASRSGNGGAM